MTTTEASVPIKASSGSKWRMHRHRRRHAKQPKTKMTKEERKAKYTAIARDRQERKSSKNLICYHCREKGHAAQHCPKAGEEDGVLCYKCGSTEHSLSSCPKKEAAPTDLSLPFAICFICQEKGHLASSCPSNTHGIYVNGGCCKICGSTGHRKSDCPENKRKRKGDSSGRVEEEDFSDLLAGDDLKAKSKDQTPHREQTTEKEVKKQRRVVNF